MREIVSYDMDIEAYHSCHKWKTQGFHDLEQGKKVLLIQVGGKWRECTLSFLPVYSFALTGSWLMIWCHLSRHSLPLLPLAYS